MHVLDLHAFQIRRSYDLTTTCCDTEKKQYARQHQATNNEIRRQLQHTVPAVLNHVLLNYSASRRRAVPGDKWYI